MLFHVWLSPSKCIKVIHISPDREKYQESWKYKQNILNANHFSDWYTIHSYNTHQHIDPMYYCKTMISLLPCLARMCMYICFETYGNRTWLVIQLFQVFKRTDAHKQPLLRKSYVLIFFIVKLDFQVINSVHDMYLIEARRSIWNTTKWWYVLY